MPLSVHQPVGDGTTPDITGEHELQTDIMRFLAILSLCLMAVFALVQSLPQVPAQEAVEPDLRPILQEQVTQLTQRIEKLKTEHRALSDELAQNRQANSLAKATLVDMQSALNTANYRLRRSAERVRRLETSIDDRSRSLADLLQRKEAEDRELRRIERRLSAAKQQLKTAETAVALQQRKFVTRDKAPAEKNAPSTPIRSKTEPTVNAIKTGSIPSSQRSVKKPEDSVAESAGDIPGFALRFASEHALRRLVRNGQIAFYAREAKSFWRLDLNTGRDRFDSAEAPSAYYEMSSDTVPTGFRQALVRHKGSRVSADTVWGVTLPAATRGRIQQLMQNRKGGELIIQADGAVSLQGKERT